MKKPTHFDLRALEIIGRLRGSRAEMVAKHPAFAGKGVEPVRKRLERLCDSGHLAAISLPAGQKLFYATAKGAKFVGAPSRFANSPNANITIEILAICHLALCCDGISFLKEDELQGVLNEIATKAGEAQSDEMNLPMSGRFFLRTLHDKKELNETLLQFVLAELRPADQLVKRADTILRKLIRMPALSLLHSLGLFGVAIVVPSEGVKATLVKMPLPTHTVIYVVPEIQDVIK